ncbi:MAG: ribbon-helix-helix domain-containing protein [Pseudomonadota bacterium]
MADAITDEELKDNSKEKSSLVLKNITVLRRRTSIRLEPEMWKALKHIARRENCTIHDLCSLISLRKSKSTSLTAAIRVFLMLYFKAAATEAGHAQAGHGDFENMKRRAGMNPDWSALKHEKAQEQQNQMITKRLAAQLSATGNSMKDPLKNTIGEA